MTPTKTQSSVRMTLNKFWDKYGFTVVCLGGGALGHVGCYLQAAALLLGGTVAGSLSYILPISAALIVKFGADFISPPKSPAEARKRLRGALALALSGVIVATLTPYLFHHHPTPQMHSAAMAPMHHH